MPTSINIQIQAVIAKELFLHQFPMQSNLLTFSVPETLTHNLLVSLKILIPKPSHLFLHVSSKPGPSQPYASLFPTQSSLLNPHFDLFNPYPIELTTDHIQSPLPPQTLPTNCRYLNKVSKAIPINSISIKQPFAMHHFDDMIDLHPQIQQP